MEDFCNEVPEGPPAANFFLQDHIRFSLERIFPINLPVPMIGLRAFERRPDFLVE